MGLVATVMVRSVGPGWFLVGELSVIGCGWRTDVVVALG